MRLCNDAHLKIPLLMVPLAALLLTTSPLFAQRSKTPPRPPITTATNLPAHVAVKGALKVALRDRAIRARVQYSVSRMMSIWRPFAVVNGYWVTPFPLKALYRDHVIEAALLPHLGANGQALLYSVAHDYNVNSLALLLTPLALEHFLLNPSQDVRACVGSAAVNATAPRLHVPATIILSLSGSVAPLYDVFFLEYSDAGDWHNKPPMYGPLDLDGDRQKNSVDHDDDGDGKLDYNDVYPFDAARNVCECGRVDAISFASKAPREFLPDLVSVLSASRAALPNGISLGLGPPYLSPGSPGVITIVF
jgi:hypothetical protein